MTKHEPQYAKPLSPTVEVWAFALYYSTAMLNSAIRIVRGLVEENAPEMASVAVWAEQVKQNMALVAGAPDPQESGTEASRTTTQARSTQEKKLMTHDQWQETLHHLTEAELVELRASLDAEMTRRKGQTVSDYNPEGSPDFYGDPIPRPRNTQGLRQREKPNR